VAPVLPTNRYFDPLAGKKSLLGIDGHEVSALRNTQRASVCPQLHGARWQNGVKDKRCRHVRADTHLTWLPGVLTEGVRRLVRREVPERMPTDLPERGRHYE